MQVECAECGCKVDRGVIVAACSNYPTCCCGTLPRDLEAIDDAASLVDAIRAALTNGDLESFSDLLDPNVTWSAPDDLAPSCRNRAQVLDWYARGRANGRHAHVLDITTRNDKVLVFLRVRSSRTPAGEDEPDRWQVLTVKDGRLVDIGGYEDVARARIAAEIEQG